ncbi:MAG: hypothetical protein WCJ30_28955, partial [Deltaproteobacteria bacterium]
GVLVTWVERRRWRDPDFAGTGQELYYMGRLLDGRTLAPLAPAHAIEAQGAPYRLPMGPVPLATSDGQLFAVHCVCIGGSGRFSCLSSLMAGQQAPGFSTGGSVGVCPSGRIAATMVGAEPMAIVPSPAAMGIEVMVGTARRTTQLEVDGEVQVPVAAPLGVDAGVFVRRAPRGIEGRVFGRDTRPRGGAVLLSDGHAEVGAPAVLTQGTTAQVVWAQRSGRSPWQLAQATWTPGGGAPVRAALNTGTAQAMAPSLVASTREGCAVLAWTEGAGHGTVVRVGQLCNGVLDPGTVVQLSQPEVEAGDCELATDGAGVIAVWQELPRGAHEELRVARLGCQ